jgi:type III secretion protein Q
MTTQPHPAVEKLRLPRLTRNEAQARSALAQRAKACRFRWGEQEWELDLTPLLDGSLRRDEPGMWEVRAMWAGAPFELLIPGQAAQAWIAARFPGLDLPELPEELLAAALENACEGLLATLAAQERGPAQLISLTRDASADSAEMTHAFALEARCGEQVVRGWLAAGSLGLMMMAGMVARMGAIGNRIPAADLPLRLFAHVGYTWLAADELAGLRPGDAVFLEHPLLTPDGELWLGQDGWGVRVRGTDTQLTVTQAFTHLELTMSSTPTPAAGDQPTPLEELPIRLEFDLGARTMSLGELQKLQVGQAIDLSRPLSSAVSLRVNGALVGMGELVEIDGRLGVTITSLASDRAQ